MPVPVSEIEHLDSVRQHPMSLDTPAGEDGTASLHDVVEDPSAVPGEGLGAQHHKIAHDRRDDSDYRSRQKGVLYKLVLE